MKIVQDQGQESKTLEMVCGYFSSLGFALDYNWCDFNPPLKNEIIEWNGN